MLGQDSVGSVWLWQTARGHLKFDKHHKVNSAGPFSKNWCDCMVYSGRLTEIYSSQGYLQQQ